MNAKQQVEARLDRALEKHIKVPRLDGRFDAGVWARIAADESLAANPVETTRSSFASRWLMISNLVGGLMTLMLLVYFGLGEMSDEVVDAGVRVQESVLTIPEAFVNDAIIGGGYVVAIAVLAFALSLTGFGRRLRASFP